MMKSFRKLLAALIVIAVAVMLVMQPWRESEDEILPKVDTTNFVQPKYYSYAYKTSIVVADLKVTTLPAVGVSKFSFVTAVGAGRELPTKGVAFANVAKPADGVTVGRIALTYVPQNEDGRRVLVNIDGREYVLPIYDWELRPIAFYANTDFYSCVSLFGQTDTGRTKRDVGAAYLPSFHPALKNTLVGLRLLQMDSFVPYAQAIAHGRRWHATSGQG